ncbi:pyridoxal phosphate-dependent aminotransferase [Lactovum miscens]|uniref:Aminotransferase n=1 Tax=Lactovum miscens TaxID=190387 RepID=A0A841C6A8_9LACT|nr:pyridoxal phosphate-dependent aminotransferase [Lactovum miscens]MBB5887807.1 aspartate aminotransferase [Lactovum miscens]
MISFSKRTNYLSDSPTLQLNDRIASLKDQGRDIINLTVGEPNFYEPEQASEAAIEAINTHFTHYTNSSGILPLRQNICEKLLIENGLEYAPGQITVSTGGKQALYNTLAVLVNEGDEIILPTPAWPSYEAQIRLVGGVPHFIQLDETTKFKLTPKLLEAAISKKSKILMLNSPSNPTGATYSKGELEELAPIIEKHELIVISDEIYERLVYEMEFVSIATLSEYLKENTIVINGFSKAFGMTGWRVGYSAAPKVIAKQIAAFQSQITASVSSVSQKAAEQAILNFDSSHVDRLKFCQDSLITDIRQTELDLRIIPDGSFYLFPNIKPVLSKTYFGKIINSDLDFCSLLLDKVGLAITPGSFFNAPNNVRISYAKSLEEIQEAGKRLRSFFSGAEA